MGVVITFYSYKGGVGRSMALANIGALLTSWGKKVLLVDWDLEAPGLENYFTEFIKVDVTKQEGLINILANRNKVKGYGLSHIPWSKVVVNIPLPKDKVMLGGRLDLLTAGLRDGSYIQNVRALDYDKFYEENDGGDFLEGIRDYWKSEYDFVIIDSRTGLTDSSGVCSIHMPDILVMLFTATEQGFLGTLDVAKKASRAQSELIYDRLNLKLLPVPTRFDSTEFKLQQDWLHRFTDGLKEVYATWVPDYPKDADINISHRELLDLTKLPYIPYFSYGEKLPVFEHGTKDPQGLGHAYETVAALLSHKLEGAKMLTESRGEYVRRAKVGLPPYEEDVPAQKPSESITASITETIVVEKAVSPVKRAIPLVLLSLVAILAVWLVKKSYSGADVETKKDSLEYALKVSSFISEFNAADTTDINSILALKHSLFEKGLQHDTTLVFRNIQHSINNILRNEIEFNLPLLYQDLAQNKFEPTRYYADTVNAFIDKKDVPVATLDTMSGYFKVKGYNNTIENDSVVGFSFDSTGYTVLYREIGNFAPGENAFVRTDDRIRIPVTVTLNDNFKITGIHYGKEERTREETKKNRIRVDIFSIGDQSRLQLYLAESIFDQLQNTPLYLPRKRVLTDAVNSREGYQVAFNEIRYNKGEEKFANEIKVLISKSTGQTFKLHQVSMITDDYLSVFIIDNKLTMQQQTQQIK